MMHGISKYILIILLLLIAFKTTRHESVLSDQRKKVEISFVDSIKSLQLTDNKLIPEYISRKGEIDNSQELDVPMELLA
ncbi:MAG: hypothetical protein C0595_06970, partial [Marinilabiliales bacterium]